MDVSRDMSASIQVRSKGKAKLVKLEEVAIHHVSRLDTLTSKEAASQRDFLR
jgi:hypothetical protein